MPGWIEEQIETFRSLNGCTVAVWVGLEMAVREKGRTGLPEFTDPAIPFLQVSALSAEMADGARLIQTYQNDGSWGLCIEATRDGAVTIPYDKQSIFRTRVFSEIPIGRIDGMAIQRDAEGDIAEVSFTVDGEQVTLSAGEVYEVWDGNLRVVRPDESILVAVGHIHPKSCDSRSE